MSPQNRQSDSQSRRSARVSRTAASRDARIARSGGATSRRAASSHNAYPDRAESRRNRTSAPAESSSRRTPAPVEASPRRTRASRPANPGNASSSTVRASRSEETGGAFAKRSIPLPLLIAGVGVLCVALFFGAFSCTFSLLGIDGFSSGNRPGSTLDINDPAYQYQSPYDWRNLHRTGDRAVYMDANGKKASLLGIDVSEHQGAIDWQKVADDGIEFAYIRIGCRGYTEGSIIDDANFETNLSGAKKAGLKVGAYFFSQATSEAEAVEEAEYVLKKLDGEKMNLPIAFDHETVNSNDARANDIEGAELVACADAFSKVIESAGYRTILYGNYSDLGRFGGEKLVSSTIWFAEYNAPSPAVNFDIVIWQYASNGNVDGISNRADMNILMDKSILE